MSNPKIMVFRMRELIYTAIFAALAIVLLILVFFMFRPQTTQTKQDKTAFAGTETAEVADSYRAGVYTASLTLSDHAVNVEVTVGQNEIKDVRLVNLGESVSAMFPLVKPAFNELAEQICQTQSTKGITCSKENMYTSQLLFQAIQQALAKARRPLS